MSRGRGKAPRGRGFGSQLEALGITTAGESAPPPILQPPPLFPQLDRKPLELKRTDVDLYLLDLKQELRGYMRGSGFYVLDTGRDEKHLGKQPERRDGTLGWTQEWKYFPMELEIKKKRRQSEAIKPTVKVKKQKKETRDLFFDDKEALKESLSHRKDTSSSVDQGPPAGDIDQGPPAGDMAKPSDEGDEAGEKESEKESGGEGTEDELYDEEIEEGTDYNLTYFDPGDDYIGEEDDALEEKEGPYY